MSSITSTKLEQAPASLPVSETSKPATASIITKAKVAAFASCLFTTGAVAAAVTTFGYGLLDASIGGPITVVAALIGVIATIVGVCTRQKSDESSAKPAETAQPTAQPTASEPTAETAEGPVAPVAVATVTELTRLQKAGKFVKDGAARFTAVAKSHPRTAVALGTLAATVAYSGYRFNQSLNQVNAGSETGSLSRVTRFRLAAQGARSAIGGDALGVAVAGFKAEEATIGRALNAAGNQLTRFGSFVATKFSKAPAAPAA